MNGAELISLERARQRYTEGYSLTHDDGHIFGELAVQAAALAVHHTDAVVTLDGEQSDLWKLLCEERDAGVIRNLVKAGALIAAEIDRLQRAEQRKHDG
jgi:hypothetical protein